jgi:hypothetical protein
MKQQGYHFAWGSEEESTWARAFRDERETRAGVRCG